MMLAGLLAQLNLPSEPLEIILNCIKRFGPISSNQNSSTRTTRILENFQFLSTLSEKESVLLKFYLREIN